MFFVVVVVVDKKCGPRRLEEVGVGRIWLGRDVTRTLLKEFDGGRLSDADQEDRERRKALRVTGVARVRGEGPVVSAVPLGRETPVARGLKEGVPRYRGGAGSARGGAFGVVNRGRVSHACSNMSST